MSTRTFPIASGPAPLAIRARLFSAIKISSCCSWVCACDAIFDASSTRCRAVAMYLLATTVLTRVRVLGRVFLWHSEARSYCDVKSFLSGFRVWFWGEDRVQGESNAGGSQVAQHIDIGVWLIHGIGHPISSKRPPLSNPAPRLQLRFFCELFGASSSHRRSSNQRVSSTITQQHQFVTQRPRIIEPSAGLSHDKSDALHI